MPSSEISEDSLADLSPYQTNGGRKRDLKTHSKCVRNKEEPWFGEQGPAGRPGRMWQQRIEEVELVVKAGIVSKREKRGRKRGREGEGRALIIVDNGQLTWAGSASCSE